MAESGDVASKVRLAHALQAPFLDSVGDREKDDELIAQMGLTDEEEAMFRRARSLHRKRWRRRQVQQAAFTRHEAQLRMLRDIDAHAPEGPGDGLSRLFVHQGRLHEWHLWRQRRRAFRLLDLDLDELRTEQIRVDTRLAEARRAAEVPPGKRRRKKPQQVMVKRPFIKRPKRPEVPLPASLTGGAAERVGLRLLRQLQRRADVHSQVFTHHLEPAPEKDILDHVGVEWKDVGAFES
ncbi:MAG: hypothetical protein MHM6MM_007212 [Cercozoa sp. M6MM]